ncbi:MAG: glutaredoxin family protein [Caldilineaceae bacterium]|nr:glutaredoxin family protein [Caldilineaceae bacterium]
MRVILYAKPACHLCDVIKLDLLDLQAEFGFDLIEYNILEDEALYDAYFLTIPVVEIDADEDKEPVQLMAPIGQIELRREIKRLSGR